MGPWLPAFPRRSSRCAPSAPQSRPGDPMTLSREFLAGLPKAELHVHHVGSASPRIVAELAARHPESPVPADPDLLAEYFKFRDFAHFIEIYLSVVSLIKTPEDVRLLTYEIAREMTGQNLRYAELTVTPHTSVIRGIAPEAFCEAIEDARVAAEKELGIVLRWIFDIPGESGLPAAEETLQIATKLQPEGLVGFGLGGPEIGVPHAGETTGPETIWDALRLLKAERIGHGTSTMQDPALVDYLGEHRIPLEISPTSNIATRAVESYDVHPLRAMVDAGLVVTINSDDPPMFGTDLTNEYGVAAELLELDEAGVAELAKTAVRASFAEDSLKITLLAEIDDYVS